MKRRNKNPKNRNVEDQCPPPHVSLIGTWTRQDKTRQDKDKTRQDKTRPDKTRQDKTRQDKTRQGWGDWSDPLFLYLQKPRGRVGKDNPNPNPNSNPYPYPYPYPLPLTPYPLPLTPYPLPLTLTLTLNLTSTPTESGWDGKYLCMFLACTVDSFRKSRAFIKK